MSSVNEAMRYTEKNVDLETGKGDTDNNCINSGSTRGPRNNFIQKNRHEGWILKNALPGRSRVKCCISTARGIK